jgi:hypothetical protein
MEGMERKYLGAAVSYQLSAKPRFSGGEALGRSDGLEP